MKIQKCSKKRWGLERIPTDCQKVSVMPAKIYKQCKNVVRSQKCQILKKPHILTLPRKVHNVTIYKKYKSTMYIKFTYPCYSISLIQIILKCHSINLIEENHFWQLTSTLIAVGGRICKFPIKGYMCFVSLFVYLSQRYWKVIHLFVM